MGKQQHTINFEGSVSKNAVISHCGKYRYQLQRTWDAAKPTVLFIMLNPSKADASQNDNTVSKCIRFAKSWGYGSLLIGNLYPFRSKDPDDLLTAENPLGYCNDLQLEDLVKRSQMIVCAWGNAQYIKKLQKKFPDYKPLKKIIDSEFHYLRMSNDGTTPWHPLYLPKDVVPAPLIMLSLEEMIEKR